MEWLHEVTAIQREPMAARTTNTRPRLET